MASSVNNGAPVAPVATSPPNGGNKFNLKTPTIRSIQNSGSGRHKVNLGSSAIVYNEGTDQYSLLTNRHVFGENPQGIQIGEDLTVKPGSFSISKNPDVDLAVLKLNQEQVTALGLNPNNTSRLPQNKDPLGSNKDLYVVGGNKDGVRQEERAVNLDLDPPPSNGQNSTSTVELRPQDPSKVTFDKGDSGAGVYKPSPTRDGAPTVYYLVFAKEVGPGQGPENRELLAVDLSPGSPGRTELDKLINSAKVAESLTPSRYSSGPKGCGGKVCTVA